MLSREQIQKVAAPSNRQQYDKKHHGAAMTFLMLNEGPYTEKDLVHAMRSAVNDGINSAIGHRGLSAWHATMRVSALLWILEDTDFENEEYTQKRQDNYGLEYFKAVADKYKLLPPPGG